MMIYIDSEYKCHTEDTGGLTAVETSYFDGKCPEYIEGYRYVPDGSTWVRADGAAFEGEMICPWRPYHQLAYAQAMYEIGIREAALAELGVTADD